MLKKHKIVKYIDALYFTKKDITKKDLTLFPINSIGFIRKNKDGNTIIAFHEDSYGVLINGVILPKGATNISLRNVTEAQLKTFNKNEKIEILWEDLAFLNDSTEELPSKMKITGILAGNYTPTSHPKKKVSHFLIPKSLILNIQKYEKNK